MALRPRLTRRAFLAWALGGTAGALIISQPGRQTGAGTGDAGSRPRAPVPSGTNRRPGAIGGTVTDRSGTPLAGARVTVTDRGRILLDEVRTGPAGEFSLRPIGSGDYRVGASRPRYGYEELPVALESSERELRLALGPDTHPGRWTTIGDTSPEFFGATNSGTLLPDGRIFYCHDTLQPIVFDPVSGSKQTPTGSGEAQGCHATSVLLDGRVIFIGGQAGRDPGSFVNAVTTVKAYDPGADRWTRLADLNEPRWYPTVVRLTDGRLLVTGGGQPPDARRTDTCEIYDPPADRWTPAARMARPSEFAPSALLLSGEVLRSWYPPELYDVATDSWRATGQFEQPDRGYPDHAPHSLVLAPDGRAVAVGMIGDNAASMVELYDPASGTWRRGASPGTLRSRPEVLLLPDGSIFVAGGEKQVESQPGATNAWGYVALADGYDPVADTWRPLAPMPVAREYHAMTILAPDGRVIVTAGTGAPAEDGNGSDNRVDAFEPPYLFRGSRPLIETLDTSDLRHGGSFTLTFSGTFAPTAVMLKGLNAVTHYVDGGSSRLVSLPFTQQADELRVELPDDSILVPAAHYLLFLMVDDIPSKSRMVRVTPGDR